MPIIFRIALRNLREHKVKSIIIGSLIAIGMILLIVGNSVIDTGKVGIQKSFIDSYSGHILVGPPGENGEAPSLFPGANFGPGGAEAKTVRPYEEVLSYLRGLPEVAALNPQVYGTVFIDLPNDYKAVTNSMGVDLASHAAMFPDAIEVVEGRMLQEGEEGIVLGTKVVDDIKKDAKAEVKVGDTLTLNIFGLSTRIKNVKLVGIVKFKNANPGLEDIGFVDLPTLRYLLGMVVGSTDQITISQEEENLLNVDLSEDMDSFFGEGTVSHAEVGSANFNSSNMYDILGDTSKRAELTKADSGAWHYILLRLKDGSQAPKLIADLNTAFKEKGWDLQAVDWEGAAGFFAQFVKGAQLFFLILVIIIAVVAVIVIMNTMVVSIIERTSEIGTMRALGARKSYIRKVFLAESLGLALAGGLAGLLIGGIAIFIFNLVGLQSPNLIFSMVFGGNVVYPVLSWISALNALVIMVSVGLLSSLYPTATALKIQPVKAMQSS